MSLKSPSQYLGENQLQRVLFELGGVKKVEVTKKSLTG